MCLLDAGTFSPYEHGEVYVLDDGGEVDLDLGNYERFLNVSLSRDNNITTGTNNSIFPRLNKKSILTMFYFIFRIKSNFAILDKDETLEDSLLLLDILIYSFASMKIKKCISTREWGDRGWILTMNEA